MQGRGRRVAVHALFASVLTGSEAQHHLAVLHVPVIAPLEAARQSRELPCRQ